MLLFVARKKNQSQDAVTAKECLKEYVANKDKWASDDQHCIALFNAMSGTFLYAEKLLRCGLGVV